MPHLYRLYGLVAASDLPLPELQPAECGEKPDIFIRLETVPEEGLPDCKRLGPYRYAASGKLWLSIPGVARFSVMGGRDIFIDPAPEIDEDSLRVFLLGSCIGALLMQRGFLLLHGNAVKVGESCLVCVGTSGVGKSTLAAAFLQQGYRILADDVVAVHDNGCVIPGFPRIKLWQDAAKKLDIDTSGLRRIRPEMEKYDFPLGDFFYSNPVPLKWVYIIETHKESGFSMREIRGLDSFLALRKNSYRERTMQAMGLSAAHLKLCGNLAGNIRLCLVKRPQWGFKLEELVEFIREDAAAHP